MSAFLCTSLHTHAVAHIAALHGLTKNTRKYATAARKANNRSLAHRYNEKPIYMNHDPALVGQAQYWVDSASIYDHYKLVACLVYQCSEGDTMETPEWKALQTLLDSFSTVIARLARTESRVWAI